MRGARGQCTACRCRYLQRKLHQSLPWCLPMLSTTIVTPLTNHLWRLPKSRRGRRCRPHRRTAQIATPGIPLVPLLHLLAGVRCRGGSDLLRGLLRSPFSRQFSPSSSESLTRKTCGIAGTLSTGLSGHAVPEGVPTCLAPRGPHSSPSAPSAGSAILTQPSCQERAACNDILGPWPAPSRSMPAATSCRQHTIS